MLTVHFGKAQRLEDFAKSAFNVDSEGAPVIPIVAYLLFFWDAKIRPLSRGDLLPVIPKRDSLRSVSAEISRAPFHRGIVTE